MSTTDAGVDLRTEADAYEYLERLRWGSDGPTACPHCGSDKGAWFLTPRDPEGRKSKGGTDSKSSRRVWKCKENRCRRQFSVLTNTTLHATKMPVRAWVGVLFELAEAEHGLSAREISERWGVAEKSAWRMLERIREAMDPAHNSALTELDDPPQLNEIDPDLIDLTAPPSTGSAAGASVDATASEPPRPERLRPVKAPNEADFGVAADRGATSIAGDAGAGSDDVRSAGEASSSIEEVGADASPGSVRRTAVDRRRRARTATPATQTASGSGSSAGAGVRDSERSSGGAGESRSDSSSERAARGRSDGSGPGRDRTVKRKRKRTRSEGSGSRDNGSKPAARSRDEQPEAVRRRGAQQDLLGLHWLDEPVTEPTPGSDTDVSPPKGKKRGRSRPASEPAELALGPSWMTDDEPDITRATSRSRRSGDDGARAEK